MYEIGLVVWYDGPKVNLAHRDQDSLIQRRRHEEDPHLPYVILLSAGATTTDGFPPDGTG